MKKPPARSAAIWYLSNFLAGFVALGPSRKVVVGGNAAATTANIIAHPGLYWTGFSGYILMAVTYVGVTAMFYQLFKPVNKSIAVMAAFFSLMGCAVCAMSAAVYIAPYVMLTGQFATAFTAAQVNAQIYMYFKWFNEWFSLSLVFFGFYLLLTGWLVYKSTFVPPILGVLLMIAGFAGMTFISPPIVALLKPWILAGGVAELLLTFWLLARGVNTERWMEMAAQNGG
jgi:hypothetical protein